MIIAEEEDQHTLSGNVLAPRSRRGSLNRLLLPSILILRVTKVSWFVADVDAMIIKAGLCQLGTFRSGGDVRQVRTSQEIELTIRRSS